MTIRAADVMTTGVLGVRADMSLVELEDALIGRRISGVPVIEGARLVGMVSRSDIVRYFSVQRSLAMLLNGRGQQGNERSDQRAHQADTLRDLTVRDIMVKEPVTVRPDAPVEEVARTMVTHHVHRVIVSEDSTVLGLISALDLVQLIADGRLRGT